MVCPACHDEPEELRFPPLRRGEAAVLFAGDILLGDHASTLIAREGGDAIFDKVRPLLRSARAAAIVGNQEGPITLHEKRFPPNKKWNYGAHPDTSSALARAGLTHLSLANNHALDRGQPGLLDTAAHLRAAGIVPFGAGANLAEATRPAVITAGHTTVAVVGTSHVWKPYRENAWGASDSRAGLSFNRDTYLRPALPSARKAADVVVLFTHWGREYKDVAEHQQREADLLFGLGADIVIGHHTHEAQRFGWRGDKPVLWSLGNFAFGSTGRFKAGGGYGLLARMVVAAGHIRRVELAPILVDNNRVKFQSRPATLDEAQAILQRLGPVNTPGFRIEAGIGILEPRPRRSPGSQVDLGANPPRQPR